MQIIFGLLLDGEHGVHPGNRLGTSIVGPLGLLNILETRLGLLKAQCTQAQRVTRYRECLKKCDTPDRFYHASFAIDPIGTSVSLLSWRDAWYLHGWNGDLLPYASNRLADLTDVEGIARSLVYPSVGERLISVNDGLSRQQTGIDSIELTDSIEDFPKRWQEVIAKLTVRHVRKYESVADAKTVLGKLQLALKSAHEGRKPDGKIAWAADGSLRVVRAETDLVAARWVAHAMTSQDKDVALVAEYERSLLDSTFDAVNIARQGFQDSSPLVPALQVLPLAYATIWDPLDVFALLQFLSHPIGPMPGYARRRLAEVIAECPGIGGPLWRATVTELEELHPERATEIREEVTLWIEQPRFSPVPGAPISFVIERTKAVRDNFSVRLTDDDPNRAAASASGYAQTVLMLTTLDALVAQGESSITPAELQALVSQCTARGVPNFVMDAQVGRVASVSDPGALVEPFNQVIWWQMRAPSMPSHYPWSQSEMSSLAHAGVDLPPLAKVMTRMGQDWLRPVLNARNQLVLVLPAIGEEAHPLWQEIQWFVEGIQPELLEELVTGSAGKDLTEVAHVPLPKRSRWWKLPPKIKISTRTIESYSSLNTFLNAPYQWVLKYSARLNSSNLLAVPDRNQLYGNLAHRLVDRFFQFNGAKTLRGDTMKTWFSTEFERVVAEEGAVLLMRGRHSDYERLRSVLCRALNEIQRQFVAANIEMAESERDLKGKFPGGDVEGQADLIVRNKSGLLAIVDMKWAGGRYRQEQFMKNRHLQLAVYAEMLRQETGMWPQISYFILETSQLLALDKNFFPEARLVQSGITGSTPLLWQQFVAAWKWRRSQLDAGMIEVVVDDIEPTLESEAPSGALPPEVLPSDFDDYRWLAGWED